MVERGEPFGGSVAAKADTELMRSRMCWSMMVDGVPGRSDILKMMDPRREWGQKSWVKSEVDRFGERRSGKVRFGGDCFQKRCDGKQWERRMEGKQEGGGLQESALMTAMEDSEYGLQTTIGEERPCVWTNTRGAPLIGVEMQRKVN